MNFKSYILLIITGGLLIPLTTLAAGGQSEAHSQAPADQVSDQSDIVSLILADYDSEKLTEEKARAIHEAFREHDLRGGPELDEAIRAAGFDPELLNELVPPSPSGDGEKGDDRRQPPGTGEAQREQRMEKEYSALTSDFGTSDFVLTSSAVEKGVLLEQYRGEKKIDGIEKSLPLSWENVPEGTQSLAIVMYHYPHREDPMAINSYLLLWGIDPSVNNIPYGEATEWYMGSNKDGDTVSYTSPNSHGPGTHEYNIALFALADYPEDLPKMSTVDVDFITFMDALENCEILGKGEMTFQVPGQEGDVLSASGPASPASGDQTPPPRPGEEKEQEGEQNYSVFQAVSDNAQLHTIAFNALAFFTGDASADTFYPPGKVTDFFGFQYFRDVDSGGMGHNTTFVPRVANNVLSLLGEEQIQKLVDLAIEQEEQLRAYGYGRYPLMIAFRKNLEQNFPVGTEALDKNAVVKYSGELYGIDGELSYRRAQVLGELISTLKDGQKARLEEMAAGGSDSWGFPDDVVDKTTLPQAAHVLVMTYASELFTWYAGDIESDTYFCPERHGTYYGGFYMKDAPVMGDPDFFIDTNATGGCGEAMLRILTPPQAEKISSLVERQRKDLDALVEVRRTISGELRGFMEGKRVDEKEISSLMTEYGETDGRINYLYASTFAEVYRELTAEQREALAELRLAQDFEPAEGYLFSEPVPYPVDVEYEFLFR